MNFMKLWNGARSGEPAWTEQLLALNPWARGLTIPEKDSYGLFRVADEQFDTAQQNATLERWAQGKQAWNDWANGMLTFKRELQKAGEWTENEKTWDALSSAVFSIHPNRHTFAGDFNARDCVFPGDASFDGATFSGDARFGEAAFTGNASFGSVTFSRNVLFTHVTFSGDAQFQFATFSGDARFGFATFSGGTAFVGATFSLYASFVCATFSGEARFSNAGFTGGAGFGQTTFSGDASFDDAAFSLVTLFRGAAFTGNASFDGATFSGATVFDNSHFKRNASFDAIESKAAFSLADATFRQVPSFLGATFRGTLRLDNVQTPRFRLLGWTRDDDASARFRELKRRAAEAKDHDREMEFFAQEIRTSRFHGRNVRPFVPKVWEWRFWFGLLYGTFSDFGRSFFRPVLFWVALFTASAVLYLGQCDGIKQAREARSPHNAWQTVAAYMATTRDALTSPPSCVPKRESDTNEFSTTNAVNEALYLALKNGLVGFDVGRSDTARRIYGCLYGLAPDAAQSPIIPYRVSLISTAQSLASGLLIFLFFLAVRNLLRLR